MRMAWSLGITLGQPRLLVFDDMEGGSAGWTVLDNERYSWEIAQPQQTQNNGQVVQPGEDNPEGDARGAGLLGRPQEALLAPMM